MDPSILGLGSFLALAIALISIGDDDDSSKHEPAPEPELSEDGHLLTGTEGDDVIDYPDVEANIPETILGGAGDDSITTEGGLRIEGGDGNDTIHYTGQGYGALLYGDAGDDVITMDQMVGRNVIFGGDGNDTINGTDQAYDEPNTIFTGTGDDVLNYTLTQTLNDYADGSPAFVLGAGADVLNLNGGDNIADGTTGGILATIENFNSEEDVLNVTLSDHSRGYTGFETVEDETGTLIHLNFLRDTEDGSTADAVATIRLQDVFNVSAASINIVTPPTS